MTMHSRPLPGVIELKGDNDGDDTSAVEKALANLSQTVDTRLGEVEKKAADLTKLGGRLDEIEKRLARPGIIGKAAEGDGEGADERKSFAAYLRSGVTEHKALTIESPGTGGVIAPPQISTQILQKVAEYSPIRSLAGKISLSAGLLQIPRLVDEVTVGEVTETSTRPESDPSFEQIDLKPHEMAVIVPVSKTVIEDSAVDIVSFVTNHIARRFGIKEASWFVTGNGTSQAEGVLVSTEVGEFDTTHTAIAADDIVDTFYSIKSAYSARGSWLMNRATMAAVRKLKDTTGQYIWQPALAAGQPPSLLGRPVFEAPDLPNPAAGNVPVVFGDFESGYLIGDRITLEIDRDNTSGWSSGIVKVLARRRVGGRVVLGEALTKLKLHA